MPCMDPQTIPNKVLRDLEREKRDPSARDPRRVKSWRQTACGRCHLCRLSMLAQSSSRIWYECVTRPPGTNYFLTLTVEPEYEVRVRLAPGELNEQRARVLAKLDDAQAKHDERPWYTSELQHERMARIRELLGEEVDALTIEDAEMVKWTKRVRHVLGWMPTMTWVSEYGQWGGRPHGHAVVHGVTRADAELIADQWRHGFVTIDPADRKGVGSYVAKDAVKGSWQADEWMAQGLTPPRLAWPRNPYVGAAMEQLSHAKMVEFLEAVAPLDFELALYGGLARHWRDGKRLRPIADTAYRRAKDRLTPLEAMPPQKAQQVRKHRDKHGHPEGPMRCPEAMRTARAAYAEEQADHVRKLDPEEAEHDEQYAKEWHRVIEKRRNSSARIERRHAKLVRRKLATTAARMAARAARGTAPRRPAEMVGCDEAGEP